MAASTPDDGDDASSAMRQKLMSAEEVYVYKIPTLKTAGGHRAEDWNLANPLKTCRLLVERRGDVLVLEFTAADTNSLFCQSSIDLRQSSSSDARKRQLEQWVESAVDTSRYFVVKIQGAGGREALVGFGFRERDQATDFRESLQFYERAMRREQEAAARQHLDDDSARVDDGSGSAPSTSSDGFLIPQLAAGEKIHVNRGGKSTITKKKDSLPSSSDKPSGGGGGGGVPLLKKKPPPASSNAPSSPAPSPSPPVAAAAPAASSAMQKMNISFGNMNFDASRLNRNEGDDNDPTDSSGGAVYEGDDEEWATEFTSA